MSARRQWLLAMLALSLTGCGIGTVAPKPTELDLGAPPQEQPVSWQFKSIVLPFFQEAKILDREDVLWRLGSDGSPNRYATFRWSSTPSNMVRERLFDRLSEHGPVLAESINAEMPQLRVTLTQFVQVYAADGSSNDGVVGLQAVLVRDGKVLAQFRATESQRATENTAPAGAAALRTATDRLIDRLLQWLSKTINQS